MKALILTTAIFALTGCQPANETVGNPQGEAVALPTQAEPTEITIANQPEQELQPAPYNTVLGVAFMPQIIVNRIIGTDILPHAYWREFHRPVEVSLEIADENGDVIQIISGLTQSADFLHSVHADVTFADYNFDGFMDMRLMRFQHGAHIWEYFWLWDDESRQFILNEPLTELRRSNGGNRMDLDRNPLGYPNPRIEITELLGGGHQRRMHYVWDDYGNLVFEGIGWSTWDEERDSPPRIVLEPLPQNAHPLAVALHEYLSQSVEVPEYRESITRAFMANVTGSDNLGVVAIRHVASPGWVFAQARILYFTEEGLLLYKDIPHIEGFPYSIGTNPAGRVVMPGGDGGHNFWSLFGVEDDELAVVFTLYGEWDFERDRYSFSSLSTIEWPHTNERIFPLTDEEGDVIFQKYGFGDVLIWGWQDDDTAQILAMTN